MERNDGRDIQIETVKVNGKNFELRIADCGFRVVIVTGVGRGG